jgi:hypothetical protein
MNALGSVAKEQQIASEIFSAMILNLKSTHYIKNGLRSFGFQSSMNIGGP